MATETGQDELGTIASVVLGAVVGLILAVPALPRGTEVFVAGVSLSQSETVLVLGALAILALPVVVLFLSALID